MVRAVLSLLLVLVPALVQAGAWARGDGRAFLSFGLEAGPDTQVLTTYAEYGLSPEITLGFDGFTDLQNESLTAILFGRYTFPAEGPHVFALGGGLGGEYRIDTREQRFVAGGPILTVDHVRSGGFLRLTAHYGRALDSGWFAADASYDVGRLESGTDPPLPDVTIGRAKLDLTYGHRASERLAVMGQLFVYDDDQSAPSYTLEASTTYDFGVGVGVIGLKQGLEGGRPSLKLGVWRSF
ncbi:MAG: hypothetical protein AAFP13_04405 [Pseudomonadota bacterium]